MTDCPELANLEGTPTPAVRDHVAICTSCRILVELLEERSRVVDQRDRRDDCVRFEMLLAARDDGTIGGTAGALLEAHLRQCADCQAVAATLPPVSERRERSSLPPVSTTAYALGREVARGGMGRILAAQDLRIGRPVAVKELLGTAPALAARFEREARVTARLQHPGIVPIYEIGQWPDGTPFYAMRMVEGRTLRETIRDKHTLDERLVLLPAVIAACEAVAFAHDKRIIHRDLTPNNILVGAHGDTVVIDWGLAKELSATSADNEELVAGPYRDEPAGPGNLTAVGAVIGTAAYMAPEQARGERVDERADVYALGAILYHVLAGEPPYRVSANEDVVRQVRAGPPAAISGVAPSAPRDLVSIVSKAIDRDPAARYSTAAQLVDELRRFQTGRLVQAHHYSRGERLRRWIRDHRGLVISLGSALSVLLVIGTIAIAGVVAARDRAETGEQEAIRQRAVAEQTNAILLEEQGRQALLQGAPVRAAVWLSASYSAGNMRPSLRLLLGSAMRDLESIERRLDCGSEVGRILPSPDETMILAACGPSTRVWRIADWTLLYTLTANGATFVGSASFSADSKQIVTNGSDGVARVWDASTGTLQHELGGHAARLSSSTFTVDGRRIVTASFDRTIRVWDATTGKLERMIEAATPSQLGVRAYLLRDNRVVSTSTDGAIKVWELRSGRLIKTIENGFQMIDLAEISNGRVVVCGVDSVAKLWDLGTGEVVRTFAGHSDNLWTCRVSADHRLLVTTSNDRTSKVWDVASGRLLQTMHHEGFVIAAALTPDGSTLATRLMSGGVGLWDVATGTLLGADDPGGRGQGEIAIVGARIFVGHDSNMVVYRGLGRSRRVFHPPTGSMIEVVSDDGSRAVVARPDGALTIWDTDRGVLVPHEPLRLPIAESTNRLVARTTDGVAIVDMHTGKTLAQLPVANPSSFELGEDGRYLLVRRDGARSEVWDIARGIVSARWDAHETPLGLATGRDRLIVLKSRGNEEGLAEIWALDPARVVQRLVVGPGQPPAAIFGHDRTRLVLVTNPGFAFAIRVFDTTSGKELRVIASATGWGIDHERETIVVGTVGTFHVLRLSDGSTISQFPCGLMVGRMGISHGGELVTGAEGLKATVELFDRSGRVLAALPFRNEQTYTQDSFQIDGRSVRLSSDGTQLFSAGKHELAKLALTLEQRPPDEVARVVSARVPLKVERGQLVPVRAPTANLRGRVTREGASVAGATVRIAATRDGVGLQITTADANGAYELRDIAAGELLLAAQSLRVGAFTDYRAVTLVPGDNRIDLELDLAGSIAGHVVDETGRPVSGVHVHAECTGCAQSDSGDDTTTSDGSFEVKALMGGGSYTLHASAIDTNEPLLPAPGQAPIMVKDGSDHVTGVRFVVKRKP